MKDEIKEILDYFNEYVADKYETYTVVDNHTNYLRILLDYITNLQQENERLKKLEYKFFYCSEDEESFTLENYLELGNKVYDLEQENERLKEEVKYTEDYKDVYKTIVLANKLLEEKYNDYKSRIEKAVEYIKQNCSSYYVEKPNYRGFEIINIEELLEILEDLESKGGD